VLFISPVLPGENLAAEIFPEQDGLDLIPQLCRGLPAQALSQAVPATHSWHSGGGTDGPCLCRAEHETLMALMALMP